MLLHQTVLMLHPTVSQLLEIKPELQLTVLLLLLMMLLEQKKVLQLLQEVILLQGGQAVEGRRAVGGGAPAKRNRDQNSPAAPTQHCHPP